VISTYEDTETWHRDSQRNCNCGSFWKKPLQLWLLCESLCYVSVSSVLTLLRLVARQPVATAPNSPTVLKRRTENVRFPAYPDAGYDAWTRTDENPELYDWLLQHRRLPAP